MSTYQNLFEMLGDVQTFSRETGAPIEIADDPHHLRLGFHANFVDGDTEVSRTWEIGIVKLKQTMVDYPDRADFVRESFATVEARQQLAARLTAGELPWWGTTPVQPIARATTQTFQLNETEREAAEAWMRQHEAENWGECITHGPRWAYVFIPWHIVTNVRIRCNGCGAEQDVTDASSI